MAWVKPQVNRGRVDAAGDTLIREPTPGGEYAEALSRINNWRSSHAYPLQALKMTLLHRAKKIDDEALVAQRLKRLSSISLKLRRNPNMKLSQMQDIGGCRAVMKNIDDVESLAAVYFADQNRGRPDRSEFGKPYNYVETPKADGYRGIHFVYKYRSLSKEYQAFNGLRIEIQIRSRLQHAWATAVETVSTFTGQALKSNIGEKDWKRFFALMGSALAMRERRPLVPGTPSNKVELIDELRASAKRLGIEKKLATWSSAIVIAETERRRSMVDARAFLLVLNSEAKTIEVTAFKKDELRQASEDYLLVETATADKPEVQAVLVSVDSIAALRSAYPNYYLDTRAFIDALRLAIGRPNAAPRP
jgi:ppGpp synthetase/RelA/SpoT-type nucleotidyltranferase